MIEILLCEICITYRIFYIIQASVLKIS